MQTFVTGLLVIPVIYLITKLVTISSYFMVMSLYSFSSYYQNLDKGVTQSLVWVRQQALSQCPASLLQTLRFRSAVMIVEHNRITRCVHITRASWAGVLTCLVLCNLPLNLYSLTSMFYEWDKQEWSDRFAILFIVALQMGMTYAIMIPLGNMQSSAHYCANYWTRVMFHSRPTFRLRYKMMGFYEIVHCSHANKISYRAGGIGVITKYDMVQVGLADRSISKTNSLLFFAFDSRFSCTLAFSYLH